jgi:hypothetical protein
VAPDSSLNLALFCADSQRSLRFLTGVDEEDLGKHLNGKDPSPAWIETCAPSSSMTYPFDISACESAERGIRVSNLESTGISRST